MIKTTGIRDILRPKGKVDLRCSVETLGLWKKRNEVEAKWSEKVVRTKQFLSLILQVTKYERSMKKYKNIRLHYRHPFTCQFRYETRRIKRAAKKKWWSMINATFVGTLKRDIRVFGFEGWVGKSWSSNKNVPCWHTIILP
ncbi:hypothetical protein V1478_003591 [Vespula squamosa]|uniref:Uncharacterized protein n=1 Tax=Vespula squamosa TaxID=30214 RepID=A0ABD2BNH2_VESSQ